MPARSASSQSAKAEKGVRSEGLITIVQPAASAAAALRVIIALGKFQGVMAAVTPTGWRMTTMRRPEVGLCSSSPLTRVASSANHSQNEAAYEISPSASALGLPCSRVMMTARSLRFWSISLPQRRTRAARSLAVRLAHAG